MRISLFIGLATFAANLYADSLPELTPLIQHASPAVVRIEVGIGQQGVSIPGINIPEHLQHLFEPQKSSADKTETILSEGSGFLISEDGYIVTSLHLVRNPTSIKVLLRDRRRFSAQLVGIDPPSDLALLKIEHNNLPFLEFAEAGSEIEGQWVVAIGSPYGFEFSSSAGIISATHRSLPTAKGEDVVPYIQTDLSINPGHSGGPLLNLKGKVLGVNMQIFTDQGNSIGLSFAVPSSIVADVIGQLQQHGKVLRGQLGATVANVNYELAESAGFVAPTGAVITSIEESGAADNSGLETDDIVLRFGGHQINKLPDLLHAIGNTRPGDKVPAVVFRDGERLNLTIRLLAR